MYCFAPGDLHVDCEDDAADETGETEPLPGMAPGEGSTSTTEYPEGSTSTTEYPESTTTSDGDVDTTEDDESDTTEEEQENTQEEPESTEEEPENTEDEPGTSEENQDTTEEEAETTDGEGDEEEQEEDSEEEEEEEEENDDEEGDGDATFADCTCGVTKDNRVVGGVETEVNKYPWMVGLLNQAKSHHCGASLIASRFVLSAAHCFDREDINEPAEIQVVIGEHNLAETGETELETKYIQVEKIIIHEDYNFPPNDIALIVLKEEVDVTIYNTVCLPEKGAKFAGQNALVYGWGALEYYTGNYPDALQEVELPVQTDEVCIAQHAQAADGGMLCAGGVEGEDACQGDSGGPLSIEIDGKHQLIGVVSGGKDCGDGENIGFFAEVSFFIDWSCQWRQGLWRW